ncbi:hypothetical protein E4U53_001925 [Claviceps sorghi]|nr:hypothetical protein E4U53_001925 [Claviceps sorghi]
MAPSKSRITLQSRLECDIDKVLKQLESSNGGQRFKSTSDAYDAIQRSNSSLKRLKKRPLEDAIDRVLLLHKQEADDSSDSEAALEKAEQSTTVPQEGGFLLNRQMTKLWHRGTSSTTTTTNSAGPSPAKKRRLQEGSEDAVAMTTKVQTNGDASTEVTLSTQQKQPPKKIQKINRYTVEHVDHEKPLGGLGHLSADLVRLTWGSLKLPGYHENLDSEWLTGIIISGPRGMGKKTLVKNIAYRLAVPLVSLNMYFFDSERMEKYMIEAFDAALAQPCSIIFIDEVHHYMARRGSSWYNDSHAKASNLFMGQMQRLQQSRGADSLHIAIATTSNIDEVDPNLLRQGLFEETLKPEMPDFDARKDVLKIAIGKMIPGDDVDLDEIARITHGFVPAEIALITKLAKQLAIKDFSDEDDVELRGTELESAFLAQDKNEVLRPSRFNMRPKAPLSMEHFKTALKGFVPALRKEGFTVIPNVTWDQVGALDVARKQLQTSIIGPIKRPAQYEEFALPRSAGVLLWGPPGCGKTLIAQAVANDAKASFILINGPELLNKYVGESERAVRELFQRARSSRPCILFFDEVDSVVPPRANASTESGARLVNALLTELDGAKDRNGVYVIGTTNRPELIDEAILRPGRLGIQIFIDLPTPSERVDILRAIYRTRHKNTAPADLEALTKVALDARCTNFSGADLSELQIKAAHSAMARFELDENSPKGIVSADWEFALNNTKPSVKDPDSYRRRNMV